MKKLTIMAIGLGVSVLLLAGCGSVTTAGMKCNYTDGSGKQSIIYVKNGMLYSEATQSGMTIKGLSRDDKFYIRSDTQTQGMVIDFSTTTGMEINGTPITTTQEMINAMQKESTCSAGNIADSLFQIPTDKTF